MAAAFTSVSVPGMFAAPKVGSTDFVSSLASPAAAKPASVTMAVDAFQRKFQSFGKINVDYSRPKKLASYKRSGSPGAMLDFPNSAAMAGHYSISNCNYQAGAKAILAKYDEYCAKGMMQVYKRAAVPTGVYTTKCTEAVSPHGGAQFARVFNRTTAFRQAQRPVAARLREQYEARKTAIVMAHGCDREEKQFSTMPMSAKTYISGKAEALGTCIRNVVPTSTAEDYMASGIRAQLIQQNMSGVYPLGYCMDGFAKGEADDRRLAALSSEFRVQQASAATVTGQAYDARKLAISAYANGCNHEEEQFSKWPSTAAAMVRY